MAIGLEKFALSDDILNHLTDETLSEQMLEEKTLQEFFGFSDEITLLFYEAARNVLEQKRALDSVNSFIFLTTLNPYVSNFWIGLGMAQELNNEYELALASYDNALMLEGSEIFPYIVAAHCCMEKGDFDRAKKIIELAEVYAIKHPREIGSPKLTEDAKAAKAYIWEKKMKIKGIHHGSN